MFPSRAFSKRSRICSPTVCPISRNFCCVPRPRASSSGCSRNSRRPAASSSRVFSAKGSARNRSPISFRRSSRPRPCSGGCGRSRDVQTNLKPGPNQSVASALTGRCSLAARVHMSLSKFKPIYSFLRWFSAVSLALLGLADTGHAFDAPPLPPPRPPDLAAPAPDLKPSPPAESPNDNAMLRGQVLAAGKIVGKSLPSVAGSGGCGIAAPIELDAVVLSGGAKVAIVPPVVLRASLAGAVADWLREDLAPAIAVDGDKLALIEGAGAYECRDRNRLASGKLSEHAIGNALDMHELVTAKGKHISIPVQAGEPDGENMFRALMKKTACTRFMTVLGPGADSFHAEHLHVDLEARHSGAHLCQWNLPLTTVAAPAHGP